MTVLRFHARHIHYTVCDYIETGLIAAGWNVPMLGASTGVTFQRTQPEEEGNKVTPNTVAISYGNELNDQLEELGGGMWSVKLPIFVDVYMELGSISMSIAADVKDLVTREKAMFVSDYTNPTSPVVSDELLYFEDVLGPEKPPAATVATDFKRHWRVVKMIAHVYYTE